MMKNKYNPYTSWKEVLERYDKKTDSPYTLGTVVYKETDVEKMNVRSFRLHKDKEKSFYNEDNVKLLESVVNNIIGSTHTCVEYLYW